jgi:hypothetical protein
LSGPTPIDVKLGPSRTPEFGKMGPAPTLNAEGVQVASDGNKRHIKAPGYEAFIDDDGCMSSLRIGGIEFFRAGVRFGTESSRGSYLFSTVTNRVLRTPNMVHVANQVMASGDLGTTVQTIFGREELIWRLANQGDQQLLFHIVFDRNVMAVTNGQGEWAVVPPKAPSGTPATFQESRDWVETSWFAGQAKLTIFSGTRIWGPWPSPRDGYQVWELIVPPRQSREVRLKMGQATPEEAAHVAKVAGGS